MTTLFLICKLAGFAIKHIVTFSLRLERSRIQFFFLQKSADLSKLLVNCPHFEYFTHKKVNSFVRYEKMSGKA